MINTTVMHEGIVKAKEDLLKQIIYKVLGTVVMQMGSWNDWVICLHQGKERLLYKNKQIGYFTENMKQFPDQMTYEVGFLYSANPEFDLLYAKNQEAQPSEDQKEISRLKDLLKESTIKYFRMQYAGTFGNVEDIKAYGEKSWECYKGFNKL